MQNATVYIFPKNKEMNLILCRDFSKNRPFKSRSEYSHAS